MVSTPIRDVVHPYGDAGLVAIAGSAGEFVAAVEAALGDEARAERLARVDRFLDGMSWDRTWSGMAALVEGVIVERRAVEEGSRPRRMAAAY